MLNPPHLIIATFSKLPPGAGCHLGFHIQQVQGLKSGEGKSLTLGKTSGSMEWLLDCPRTRSVNHLGLMKPRPTCLIPKDPNFPSKKALRSRIFTMRITRAKNWHKRAFKVYHFSIDPDFIGFMLSLFLFLTSSGMACPWTKRPMFLKTMLLSLSTSFFFAVL